MSEVTSMVEPETFLTGAGWAVVWRVVICFLMIWKRAGWLF